MKESKKSESPLPLSLPLSLPQNILETGDAVSSAVNCNLSLDGRLVAPPSENQDKPSSPIQKASKKSVDISKPSGFQHVSHAQFNSLGVVATHTYSGKLVDRETLRGEIERKKGSPDRSPDSDSSSSSSEGALSKEEEKEQASHPKRVDNSINQLIEHWSKFNRMSKEGFVGATRRDGLRLALQLLRKKLEETGAKMSIWELEMIHSIFSEQDNKNRDGMRLVYDALMKKATSPEANMTIDEVKKAEALFNAMLSIGFGDKKVNTRVIESALINARVEGDQPIYSMKKQELENLRNELIKEVQYDGANMSIEDLRRAEAILHQLPGNQEENKKVIHLALKQKVFYRALDRLIVLAPTWPSKGPFREIGGPGRDNHAKIMSELTTKNIDDLLTKNPKEPLVQYGNECSEHLFLTGLLKCNEFFEIYPS